MTGNVAALMTRYSSSPVGGPAARADARTRAALLAAIAAINRAGSINLNPIVALNARERAGDNVSQAECHLLVRAVQNPARMLAAPLRKPGH